METNDLNPPNLPAKVRKRPSDDVRALRALRLMRGFSRTEAAKLCDFSARAIEQLENGRCGISPQRIERIVQAFGFTMRDFSRIKEDVGRYLKAAEKAWASCPPSPAGLRRNYHRIITKEVRIIRIMRRRRGLTQYQAAAACGYANSIFGQIENGRIELPRPRIRHIIEHLGCDMKDFDRLMAAEVLRDELIAQCSAHLEELEDTKLESAKTVIQALTK